MKLVRWARMMHLEAGIGLAALGVVGYLAACSDDHRGITEPPLVRGPSFEVVVSEPVRLAFGGSAPPASAASAALQQGDSVTWVSLPIGTVPGGRSATIRNLANGFTAAAEVEDGGFDPVPLLASVGDSIEVLVSDGGDGTTRVALVVPPRRPPVIVRTVPPRGGTDVPLNSLIRVVFSEPMDQATITTATVRLLRDTAAVAGAVVLSPDGLRADFVPDSLLARATRYTLVVDAGVTDLSGDELGASLPVDFTTGNQSAASPVASVTITPGSAELVAFAGDTQPVFPGMVFGDPGWVLLTATVRDSNGAPLTDAAIRWSSSNPSVVRAGGGEPDTSGTASAYALAPGNATITATVDSVAGTAAITVLTASVEPAAATLRIGQTVRVVATVRDAAGNVQTGWTQDWGTNGSAVGVSSGGVVTAMAAGIQLVYVRFHHAALFGIGLGGSAFVRITVGSGGPVASVVVAPDTVRTVPIGFVLLRASVRDGNGAETYAPLSWSIAPQQCGLFNCNGVEPDDAVWNEGRVQMNDLPGNYAVTVSTGGRGDTTAVISDYITVAAVSNHEGDGGGYGQCALTTTGQVYCQGPNGSTSYGIVHSYEVGPVAVVGGLSFSAISGGGSHRCALATSGAVYCWGTDYYGELGTGGARLEDCDTDPHPLAVRPCSPAPVPVAGGFNFARITSALDYSCALTAAGAAWCWGGNYWGQLGDGTTSNRSAPVAVSGGLTFTQISAGGHHACALTAAGLAYCWGGNQFGQLGNGSTTASSTPVPVAGGLTFTGIAAGWGFTCALASGGAAYCWGDRGRLANVVGNDSPTPVLVAPGLTFAQIGAGGSCGRTGAGEVYCWGAYWSGDDADTGIVVGPTLLAGGLTFASLSTEGSGSCGITTSSVAYCWTYNPYQPVPYPGYLRKLWGQR
jgi:hypothetical protein